MSSTLTDPVVVEFEHRRAEPPREIREGRVATYPALEIDEEGATCDLCGFWGVVPARSAVLEALAIGTDRALVCAHCADDVDLEVG